MTPAGNLPIYKVYPNDFAGIDGSRFVAGTMKYQR